MIRRALVTAGCLMAPACGGGDGGTGPSTTHSLAGSWVYNIRSMRDGHGMTCDITGSALALQQSGTEYGGSISGGALECRVGSSTYSDVMGTGVVSAGWIRGDSTGFHIDDSDWNNVGRIITADSLGGTVNGRFVVNGTLYTLAGTWAARRQP